MEELDNKKIKLIESRRISSIISNNSDNNNGNHDDSIKKQNENSEEEKEEELEEYKYDNESENTNNSEMIKNKVSDYDQNSEKDEKELEEVIVGNFDKNNYGSKENFEKFGRKTYFNYSEKKFVDYVLVYEKNDEEEEKKMRNSYEENLKDFGLEMEVEEDEKNYFLKIHCPFDSLCRAAELTQLKKPVRKKNIKVSSSSLFGCCRKENGDKAQVHQRFSLKEKHRFIIEDEDTFFSSGERSYLVNFLLEKALFQDGEKVKTGLGPLLGKGVYKAGYPLHDPVSRDKQEEEDLKAMGFYNKQNEREWLIENWGSLKKILSPQPFPQIRNYFGEQFTFYFAWIGLYTVFLFFASIFGVACFIYGLAKSLSFYSESNALCNVNKEPGNFTICPKCDFTCNYTILSDSCSLSHFSTVFDNEATVACAIFITFWGICFIEVWKRTQNYFKYLWSVNDYEENENIRPQYHKHAKKVSTNPISGLEEYTIPKSSLLVRKCISLSIVLFFFTVIIAVIISVLIYRLAAAYALYKSSNHWLQANAKIITTITSAILNVIAISLLSLIYKRIAKYLTDLEGHKTKSSFEDSYIFKMVVFQFINYYGSIIYIAFFKGSFVDTPGYNDRYMLGIYRQDQCDENGCFSELTIQLIIIMIGKQLLNSAIELLLPAILKCFRSKDNTKTKVCLQWEQDLDLTEHHVVLMFSEYLEMVIQYGFVIMFVAAFPLAPLFAFFNNILEIRLDGYKLLRLFRRSPGYKSQDIGAWQKTITTFTYLAVVTNAFIIAWTSDFIPRQVYKYRTIHNSSITSGQEITFMHWALAPFNVSNFMENQRPDPNLFPLSVNVTQCRYRTFSAPSEQITEDFRSFYWQIFCARWAFVIIFEHICFVIMSLARTIPDKSDNAKLIEEYEKSIHHQVVEEDLFQKVRLRKKTLKVISPILSEIEFHNSVYG